MLEDSSSIKTSSASTPELFPTPFIRDSSSLQQLISTGYNPNVSAIKNQEYAYLSTATYLDHSGATLYPTSLVDALASHLKSSLLGNPHSDSPSSVLATQETEAVRKMVLQFFRANENEWDVVFCANATAGIKLVAEAFGNGAGFEYKYHRDSHTSLIGVRELADTWSCFESDEDVERWLDSGNGSQRTSSTKNFAKHGKHKSVYPVRLLAYPGQSNFTGRRLPLTWAQKARQNHGYYTLLDAAALLMTKSLDLSNAEFAPDFVVCSWYKIFGMPDLGSLIVKKSTLDVWRRRRYFGGGTVAALAPFERYHKMRFDSVAYEQVKEASSLSFSRRSDIKLHGSLEDGTIPFHSIIMLGLAFREYTRLYGQFSSGIIAGHCSALAQYLYTRLVNLRHRQRPSQKVIEFYPDSLESSESRRYLDSASQGPVLSFNVLKPNGTYVGFHSVGALAAAANIHIRTGGNCNPAGVQHYCGYTSKEFKQMFDAGKECGDEIDLFEQEGAKGQKRPTGVVRVSLGAVTTLEDVQAFLEFVEREFVHAAWDRQDVEALDNTASSSSTLSDKRGKKVGTAKPRIVSKSLLARLNCF